MALLLQYAIGFISMPQQSLIKNLFEPYREGLPRSNSLREVSSDNQPNDDRELQEASYDDFEIMDCPENHSLDSQEYIWLFPSFIITDMLMKTKQKWSSGGIYRAGSADLPYLLS